MTFNIRNGLADDGPNSWDDRCHLTAEVIRKHSPDVIGLQEVFDFQLDYLLGELPSYEHYSVGRDDGLSGGEHCTILWNPDRLHPKGQGTFWLSATPETPGSRHWENRITRICSWVEFEELTFFNTHLDHESAMARSKGSQLIHSRLPETPWILLGDFNALPTWNDIYALNVNPNISFVTRDNKIGTFHGFAGGNDGDLIDHIFTSKNWRVSELTIDLFHDQSIYPSDHYPVIAKLHSEG